MRFWIALLLSTSGCITSSFETQEFINVPNSLEISFLTGSTYKLSFFSDNREGGFSGYGIFTATSAAALDVEPTSSEITAANGFCQLSGQAVFQTKVAIQIGPQAAGLIATPAQSICDITTLTLTQGQHLAIRARVQRASNLWSKPAKTVVP